MRRLPTLGFTKMVYVTRWALNELAGPTGWIPVRLQRPSPQVQQRWL